MRRVAVRRGPRAATWTCCLYLLSIVPEMGRDGQWLDILYVSLHFLGRLTSTQANRAAPLGGTPLPPGMFGIINLRENSLQSIEL